MPWQLPFGRSSAASTNSNLGGGGGGGGNGGNGGGNGGSSKASAMDFGMPRVGKGFTLYDALGEFFSIEDLGGDDCYRCERCKTLQ